MKKKNYARLQNFTRIMSTAAWKWKETGACICRGCFIIKAIDLYTLIRISKIKVLP